MSEIGNPFMDLSGDLLVLDTIVVADCTVVESVQTIEKIGQQNVTVSTKIDSLPELNS